MSLDEILNTFLTTWEKDYPTIKPLEDEEEWVKRGKNIVKSYCRREVLSDFNPVLVEKKFSFDINSTTRLNGIFDRVDFVGNKPVIMEFKTHLNRELSLLQLKTYSFAYYEVYGRMAEKAILYSIETGEKVEYVPNFEDVEMVKKFLSKVAKDIMKGEFKGVPSSWNCRFCPAKDICPSFKNISR